MRCRCTACAVLADAVGRCDTCGSLLKRPIESSTARSGQNVLAFVFFAPCLLQSRGRSTSCGRVPPVRRQAQVLGWKRSTQVLLCDVEETRVALHLELATSS
jgi:hypothetical protein